MYFCSTAHNLNGSIFVPGSKSHTIRAAIIATLAKGTSRICNPLLSADCLSAIRACRLFGAVITEDEQGWTIEGTGGKVATPDDVVDCGNSGTTLYFVTPMACLAENWSVVTGDDQIRKRPISPLLDALKTMGVTAFTTRGGKAAPAVIKGPLKPGLVKFEGKLSQFVSGLMLTAPYLNDTTRIELETPMERPYYTMTIEWMRKQGVTVNYDEEGFKWFEVPGNQCYTPVNDTIPSDWEAVAFPLAAAAITDSTLTITNLDLDGNQGDSAIVDVMIDMGADITLNKAEHSLTIRGGKPLHGTVIDCIDIPDAVPMLAAMACFAEGDTTLTNLEVVRLKETDRVKCMHDELKKFGAKLTEEASTLTIHGTAGGKGLKGAQVNSYDDHRIAMALTVAGLALPGETVVSDGQCCAISFPNFFELMNSIGAGLTTRE